MITLPCGWKIEIEPLKMDALKMVEGYLRQEMMVWDDEQHGKTKVYRKPDRFILETHLVYRYLSNIIEPKPPFEFHSFNGRQAMKLEFSAFLDWWLKQDIDAGFQIIDAIYTVAPELKRRIDKAYQEPLLE